jgi:acetyltransferase-like isoleucine patch superfamily enzyme
MPVADDVKLGQGVIVYHPELVNLYGCSIGERSTVAPFVEIGRGVQVGARCKIASHSYICTGVTIEDEVFVGHGVMFCNDINPRVEETLSLGHPALLQTLIKRRASIGSGVVIMGGVTVGADALIGAGAVVTSDVPDGMVVAGVPARLLGQRR